MAVQPISMEVFVRTYTKILFTSIGAKLLLPMVKKFIDWRSEYPLEEMSPKEYAKDLKTPTLYAQARNDPWTELSDIQSFYENTPEPKEFYWIENTKHRFESYSYFQDNPEKMLKWFGRWM
jgi:alpha-beta hydrolase superfamily lysophospholipase